MSLKSTPSKEGGTWGFLARNAVDSGMGMARDVAWSLVGGLVLPAPGEGDSNSSHGGELTLELTALGAYIRRTGQGPPHFTCPRRAAIVNLEYFSLSLSSHSSALLHFSSIDCTEHH